MMNGLAAQGIVAWIKKQLFDSSSNSSKEKKKKMHYGIILGSLATFYYTHKIIRFLCNLDRPIPLVSNSSSQNTSSSSSSARLFLQTVPKEGRCAWYWYLLLGNLPDIMATQAFAWHDRWVETLIDNPAIVTTSSTTDDEAEHHPPVLYHRFYHIKRVAVWDPEDLQYVLNGGGGSGPASSSSFSTPVIQKPVAYERMAFFIGRGLLSLINDEEHASHRKHVAPAFSPKALASIAQKTVNDRTREMVEEIRRVGIDQKKSLQAQQLFASVTLDIIAQAAFNCTDPERKLLRSLLDSQSFRMSGAILVPFWQKLPLRNNKQIKARNAVLYEATSKIIQRIKSAGPPPEDGEAKALIDYLVFNDALSEKSIAEHVITFVFAGYETTANMMNFICYMLAQNPTAQARVYEELSSLFAINSSLPLDQLKVSAKYTQCVIKEVLRLYPTATQFAREVQRDCVLPGSKVFLPAGVQIIVNLWLTHRSKKYWGEDAEEFRPERWEDDPELEQRMTDRGAYIPFSSGRRNCIGQQFALNEMLLLTAAVFRNFKVTLAPGQKPLYRKIGITMSPTDPLLLDFENRV